MEKTLPDVCIVECPIELTVYLLNRNRDSLMSAVILLSILLKKFARRMLRQIIGFRCFRN